MNDTLNIDKSITNNILSIIKKETGIVLRDEKLIDFNIVVRSRIINNKLTPQSYIRFLENNDKEIITLASFFTIQETCFYRNKNHFDRFKTQVLPELIEKRKTDKNKKLTIVSAGCATGEEPYTLAMIIKELSGLLDDWDIKIIATDIYDKALKHAKDALYSTYKLRNLDIYYIKKYFKEIINKNITEYRLKESITSMVEFKHINLIKEPFQLGYLRDVDIIFCENVMIYFNIESIQRLITNFYTILCNNGYLFLGYAETLNMINHNFLLSWWQGSFAYVKSDKNTQAEGNDSQMTIPDKREQSRFISTSYNNYIFLALQNYKANRPDNVALIIEEIEKHNMIPDTDFYLIKGELLLDRQDFINSAHNCRNAISIKPYFLDAHLMLSDIYLQLDMPDKADFEIKTCLFIDHASILSYYYYVQYCKITNDLDCYHKTIKKIKQLFIETGIIFSNNLFPINEKRRNQITNDIMKYQEE